MGTYHAVIELSAEEREELTGWSNSRTLPAGDVFKARLILALADGKSYSAVEGELKTSRPTIARWRARFEQARIEGLEGQHKGSRPRKATPSVQARILKKTQHKPANGSTHWSCRKMAAAVGVSPATVHRIWAKARLKPHRLDRYMASNDPAFEEKAADIVALYMDPPQHAAVFCVDEKTAIQARHVGNAARDVERLHDGDGSGVDNQDHSASIAGVCGIDFIGRRISEQTALCVGDIDQCHAGDRSRLQLSDQRVARRIYDCDGRVGHTGTQPRTVEYIESIGGWSEHTGNRGNERRLRS